MAVVVEDGTGLANADAYVSQADTDAYWAARTTNTLAAAWAAASSTLKDSAIRVATEYLDTKYSWKGLKLSSAQSLVWPRTGVFDELDTELVTQVPVGVEKACYELAARALSEDLRADSTQDDFIESEKIGPMETKFRAGSTALPTYRIVNDLVAPYVLSSGSVVTLVRA